MRAAGGILLLAQELPEEVFAGCEGAQAVAGGAVELFGGQVEVGGVSSPAFFGPGSYWSYATAWLFSQAS